MLTLEQIRKQIKDLQEYVSLANVNTTEMKKQNQILFLSFFQENEFYFLSADQNCEKKQLDEKNFLPFIANPNENSQIPYLRIFSHREVAVSFAESVGLSNENCVKLTAEESIQLAKYWLVRGVYGYMLNDGDIWITTSFSSYLSIIFQDFFKDSTMYNSMYANWMDLLVLLDNEEGFSLEQEEDVIYLKANPIGTVTISELIERKNTAKIITVEHQFLQFSGSMESFLEVYNEYISKEFIKNNTSFDFKDIDYVNLSLRTDNLSVLPEISEEIETLGETEEPDSEENTPTTANQKEKFTDLIKSYARKRKKKHEESQRPIETENIREEGEHLERKKGFKMIAFIIALIAGCSILFVSLSSLMKSDIKEFSSELDQGKFYQAGELYNQNITNESFTASADEVIKHKIDNILADYADNRIDANTAGAMLAEYKNFSNLQLYINDAMNYASQLEKSKNNFVKGNEALQNGHYLQCLEYWSYVIDKDINYNIVKKAVDEKKESFISNGLLECSLYLKNQDISHYQAGIILMHQWFPLDKNVELAYKEINTQSIAFGNTTTKKDSSSSLFDKSVLSEPVKQIDEQVDSPIEISKLSVSLPQANGAVNLMIDWVNTSNRVIKDISFLVQARDEFGKEGKCYKRDYSMYQAMATGVWETGHGMDSKEIYWKDVWYNSMIRDVDLLRVDITYSDGSIVSVTEKEQLKKMFN